MARRGFSTTNYLKGSAVVTAAPVTLACWCTGTSPQLGGTLIDLHNSASLNTRDHFRLLTASTMQMRTGDSASNSGAVSSAGMPQDVWAHIAGTSASATNRAVYLNGVRQASNTTSRVPSGIDSTYIGVNGGTVLANAMDGAIAHVAVWNVDLTELEVALLASRNRFVSPFEIRPSQLVAYWKLDGRNDSVEFDYSGHGNHLTVNGQLYGVDTPGWMKEALKLSKRFFILAAPPSSTLRSDNFNRADQFGLGTPSDAGSAWVGTGSSTLDYAVSGNAATVVNVSGFDPSYLETGSANHTAQMTVVSFGNDFSLVVRLTDGSNFLYWSPYTLAGVRGIWKKQGGSSTQLLDLITSLADGDTFKLSVDANNLISAYKNGVFQGSVTSSFNSTATKVGFYGDSDGGELSLDNFLCESVVLSGNVILEPLMFGGGL